MTVDAPALDETFAVPADEARLDRASAALREKGFTVHVVDTVADARKLLADLLPRDQEIFTASSETLRLSGIAADIDEASDFVSVRRQAGPPSADVWEQIRLGATPDVIVGSVHAVTEDGYLLAASGSGSQLGPYAAGAKRVFWVVGAQKVVADIETALRRIRTYSLPREIQRLQELYGQSSLIGKILIIDQEAFPDRGNLILVRESIGF